MYDPIAVANYFLELAGKDSDPSFRNLDPLKLQKLLFIAHGWSLTLHEMPLLREPVGVWKLGPVVESVYHEFKRFRSGPITEPGTRPYKFDSETVVFYTPELGNAKDEIKVKGLLQRVWDSHKEFTGIRLSYATHRPESPWDKARKQGLPHIPPHMIKEHYDNLRERSRRRDEERAEAAG